MDEVFCLCGIRMKHLKLVLTPFVFAVLIGCNNFEKRFYKAIDDGGAKLGLLYRQKTTFYVYNIYIHFELITYLWYDQRLLYQHRNFG